MAEVPWPHVPRPLLQLCLSPHPTPIASCPLDSCEHSSFSLGSTTCPHPPSDLSSPTGSSKRGPSLLPPQPPEGCAHSVTLRTLPAPQSVCLHSCPRGGAAQSQRVTFISLLQVLSTNFRLLLKIIPRVFPVGPVVKTLSSQYRFHP